MRHGGDVPTIRQMRMVESAATMAIVVLRVAILNQLRLQVWHSGEGVSLGFVRVPEKDDAVDVLLQVFAL